MLADIEPWQFIELEAAYRLDPWGDDWTQTAHIEAAIKNTMGGGSVGPSELIPNEDNPNRGSGEIDDANLKSRWQAKLGY